MLGVAAAADPAFAQRTDTTAAGAKRPKTAPPTGPGAAGAGSFPTGVVPPISPRTAFLYSFVVPGLAQARLDRPVAGALFAVVEGIGLAMTRQTRSDLRLALRYQADSIPIGYRRDSTGATRAVLAPSPFYTPDLVKSRRTQHEDWIAVLVFNHLLAGADAFVAAQLWDLPATVSVRGDDRAVSVRALLRW